MPLPAEEMALAGRLAQTRSLRLGSQFQVINRIAVEELEGLAFR